MSSSGKSHHNEEELRKLLESLNISQANIKDFIEQQRSDSPQIINLTGSNYNPSKVSDASPDMAVTDFKEIYNSSNVKASKCSSAGYQNLFNADSFTRMPIPRHQDIFKESRLSPVYSYPTTSYGFLGGLVTLLVIVGIIILIVVLLLKFLF